MSETNSFVRNFFLLLLLGGLVVAGVGSYFLSFSARPPTSEKPAASASPPTQHMHAYRRSTAEAPSAEGAAPAGTAVENSIAPGGSDAAEIARSGELLAKLRPAPAVLDAPKAMTIGQTRPVELRVGVGVPAEALTKPGEPGNQQIPGQTGVSPNMMATLDGAGFTVRATTPERLPISEGNITFWRWDVEAQEAGEHDLKATLYALIEDRGQTMPYQVKTYDQLVVVSVKAKTFSDWLAEIAEDADKLKAIVLTLGGLAMTIGGWLGFSRARKTGATPNPS